MPAEAGDPPGCTPLRRRLPAVLWIEHYFFEYVEQIPAALWNRKDSLGEARLLWGRLRGRAGFYELCLWLEEQSYR